MIYEDWWGKSMDFNVFSNKRKAQKKQFNIQNTSSNDIAIIGMAVKFPEAENLEDFWNLMKDGKDLIKDFPTLRRKDIENYLTFLGIPKSEIKFQKGAYLKEIDKFDYKFFHLTPKEASLLDPCQRVFLQTAWKAIEDSGYCPDTLKKRKIGVYAGISDFMDNKYIDMITNTEWASKSVSAFSNFPAMSPSRLSYLLDFKGPSMVIDTACSSTAVAVHVATQSLKNKECEIAIVGGVRLHFFPVQEEPILGIESSDGKTKSFDDSSDGTGIGEGAAVVILKQLNQAIKDKDNIYAVIKGSAVNQDGSSAGITAPNAIAQAEVIEQAWENAGIKADSISYIEAHGTGTKLGDPIEIDGIEKAFTKYTHRKQFCAIGSIKSNIGHLYDAAGMISLVKCVLSLQKKQIPPTLHFNRPNKDIHLENSPVFINDRLRDWEVESAPRRCGLSSFGMSGTNCHIIFEEGPQKTFHEENAQKAEIFTLSAKSENSFTELIKEYISLLSSHSSLDLSDLCYTLNTGRNHFNIRLAIQTQSKEELLYKLEKFHSQSNYESIPSECIYYGQYSIVTGKNMPIKPNQLTANQKDRMTKKANQTIRQLLQSKRDISCILSKYTNGADINWNILYKDRKLNRVSLPTYPFEKNRCWIVIPEGMIKENTTKNQSVNPTAGIEIKLIGKQNDLYSVTEKSLAQIIGQVMGYKEIDISVNFFELGGDSLLITEAYDKVNELYPEKLRITDFFEYKTIAELAAHLDYKINLDKNSIQPKRAVFQQSLWTNDEQTYDIREEDVAIIGIATKLPMAENTAQFWSNLLEGKYCVTDFPENRKKDIIPLLNAIHRNGREFTFEKMGYLDEIDKFDYSFFRISPKEAIYMDPNQRLLLETSWSAIEDAGYNAKKMRGSNTGVFMSYGNDLRANYLRLITENEEQIYQTSLTGNLPSIIPSRISYFLDLKGPSMVIDTACSSSLVSIHEACHSIRKGECDMALAGGVKLSLLPTKDKNTTFEFDSSDDKTRAFDNEADGTINGEGAAVVVLKSLKDAVRDRDNVYAVIKGSAINQDGTTIGIAAPSSNAQSNVILKAWEDSGIDPITISYIETHGTGTKLGDPIEIAGIQKAFSTVTNKKQFCGIGSVKTNIGHLYEAAGVVNLVKATLAIKNKKVPASLHFNQPNDKVEFERLAVYVNDRLQKWESPTPIRCGVSSFGLSGTNAHVILEEFQFKGVQQKNSTTGLEVFTISANSEKVLKKLITDYVSFLQKDTHLGLKDICFTVNTGRGIYTHRMAIIISSLKELLDRLKLLNREEILTEVDITGVFYGKSKHHYKEDYSIDAEVTEILNDFNKGKQEKYLEDLCRKYIRGFYVPWEELYLNEDRYKVSLPSYPFDRVRCWIDIQQTNKVNINSITDILNNYELPEKLGEEVTQILEKLKGFIKENHVESQEQKNNILLIGREDGQYSETERKVAQAWSNALGFKELDIDKGFYELGGDSIHAVSIANDLTKELKRQINIVDILNNETIAKLSRKLSSHTIEEKGIYEGIKPIHIKENYELSSAQSRMFIQEHFEGINTSYNIPIAMIVKGEVSVERFKSVFDQIIERHESFRTTFEIVEDKIVQIVREQVKSPFTYINDKPSNIHEYVIGLIKPFDLKKAPLLRVYLIKVDTQSHLLFIDMHHIISDGISVNIITKDFIELYKGNKLPKINLHYKDFAAWQNKVLTSEEMKDQEEFWMTILDGDLPVLEIPTDFPRPSTQAFEGDRIFFQIGEALTNSLYELAAKYNTTLYTILLASYNILLSKYSSQEDIIVGTPVAGRNHPDLKNIVGMFVNSLAMRNQPTSNKSFLKFLEEVKENAFQAYKHQDYQFDELVKKIITKRNLGRHPIFDTMFILQNQNMEHENINVDNLVLKPFNIQSKITLFDISLEADEKDGDINFIFEYCTKLFKRKTIEAFKQHFIRILNIVTERPEILIGEISLITEDEKDYVLHVLNHTDMNTEQATIKDLFELQVDLNPNKIAVVYQRGYLTYRELNRRANQLAHKLIHLGVKEETIVGLLIERSIDTIISIIAIVKAGGAYLPIDSALPQERMEFMLKDSQAKILITHSNMPNIVTKATKIYIDQGMDIEGNDHNPTVQIHPSHLLYVLYTSGSTGTPKGVLIEHKNVVRLLFNNAQKFDFNSSDCWTMFHSYSFDFSVWEMYGALLNGGKLIVVPLEIAQDPKRFLTLLENERVTVLNQTPPAFDHLSKLVVQDHKTDLTVRYIIFGGDELKPFKLKEWKEKYPETKLINMYGITETTVHVTYKEITNEDIRNNRNNIGHPIPTLKVYIFDKNGNIQPTGVPGEIYVAGLGVARGYLNRDKLSKEKFITNPYNPLERLYKTGDLGRWNHDGSLEYYGRIDYQVQVRGHRVEIGEIEATLLNYSSVKDAIVLDKKDDDGNTILVGYIVPRNSFTVEEIHHYLSSKLPDYMIPSQFLQLEGIPLTPNGKVDREKLLSTESEFQTINTGIEYMRPRNPNEEMLRDIWEKILGVSNISIKDNFFILGGDSIKAIQISMQLQKMNVRIAIKDVFQNPTIEELSNCVTPITKNAPQDVVTGEIELTPIQKWFFENNLTNQHHYNQAIMIQNHYFDETLIRKVFDKIIEHHDALRMVYHFSDNKIIQENRDTDTSLYDFETFNLINESQAKTKIEELANTIQASISLTKGPLVKLALFKTKEGDHLLIAIHHLVIDGVSWRILSEDFNLAYGMALENQEIHFINKTNSYKKWSEQLQKYSTYNKLLEELSYWKRIEETYVPSLPFDHDTEINLLRDCKTLSFKLTKEQTKQILTTVNKAYNTEINDILLVSLGLAYKEWTGKSKLLINLEGHGREEVIQDIDISRTIGWFTTMYPHILEINSSHTLEYKIKYTKETLRKLPNKGFGYSVLKYLTPKKLKSAHSFKSKPQVNFNYLGQFDTDINLPNMNLSSISVGDTSSLDSQIIYPLDINGIVLEERLKVTIQYSSKQFNTNTIQKLTDLYCEKVLEVISHCMNKEETELTPSDLGYNKLSIEGLDNIKEILKYKLNK